MNTFKSFIPFCFIIVSFQTQASWEKEFLFGISGGLVRDLGLYSIDVIYQGGSGGTNIGFNDGEDDSGTVGGLITGVQATCSNWLLGVELRINHFSMDHHRYFNFPAENIIGTWYVDGQIKHGNDFGLLVRLGYTMTPYLLTYMHLGAETSRDRLRIEFSGAPNVYPRSVLIQEKKQIYRYTGGVGVECPAPCIKALSFRLEYMFHMPEEFLEGSGRIQDGVINPLFTANIKPRTQSIEGAIIWNVG
jgi:hypothetical protein